jgi:hypothetical protein
LAQILGQVGLNRCETKVIQKISFDDKPDQEFSHASSAVV